MSHLTTPLSIHSLSFSEVDYKQLRRKKNLQAAYVVMLFIAWVVVLFIGPITLLTMFVLIAFLAPIISAAAKGGSLRNRFMKLKADRHLVMDAYSSVSAFVHRPPKLDDRTSVRVEVDIKGEWPSQFSYRLKIIPRDTVTGIDNFDYAVWEYIINYDGFETVQGPALSTILQDLKTIGLTNDVHADADARLKSKFFHSPAMQEISGEQRSRIAMHGD